MTDAKTDVRDYLQEARDVLLLEIGGLSEYDVRRPLTPTGTNLLGLVKYPTSPWSRSGTSAFRSAAR